MACTRAGSSGNESSNAARAWVSLRSGSPDGRNRSSPHQRSTLVQSMALAAGRSLTVGSTLAAIRPPVSTPPASPRAACASMIVTTRRAATADASVSASGTTTTRVSLTGDLRSRKAVGVPRGDRWPAEGTSQGSGSRVAGPGGQRRVLPHVHPHRRLLVQVGDAGHGAQRLTVDLVGVEPAQLLGQFVTHRPFRQRHVPVLLTGPAEQGGALLPGDLDEVAVGALQLDRVH